MRRQSIKGGCPATNMAGIHLKMADHMDHDLMCCHTIIFHTHISIIKAHNHHMTIIYSRTCLPRPSQKVALIDRFLIKSHIQNEAGLKPSGFSNRDDLEAFWHHAILHPYTLYLISRSS